MGRLDDKVAVITGTGGGMGREAAILFTEEGARACVADVNAEAAEETVALCTGEAFAVEVDVADDMQVASMYEQTASRFGGLDVLYNNAGISPGDDASVLETSVDAWQRVQDVNTKGVFLCCKHGIPYLLERGVGSVINVASFVAIVGAATSQSSYTASKGAVLAMSRELAVEFARRGVRVNALCPGPVETPAAPVDLRRRPGGIRAEARPLADAEAREAPRDRAGGALPRERVVVRERRDLPRRRGPDRLLRHAGVGISASNICRDIRLLFPTSKATLVVL
jgi:NAD(P)-dependent dehydrogenase (short-subunit alcohol dehydrogenase family)